MIGHKLFQSDLDLCIVVILPTFHAEGIWQFEMLKLIILVTVLVKTGVASLRSLPDNPSRPVALFSFRFMISFITFSTVNCWMGQFWT